MVAGGASFRVYSRHARAVWLCLLDVDPQQGLNETRRLAMQHESGFFWHVFVPDCLPGQRYGFRAEGPFAPEEGHYFNPSRLLLDPYAICVEGDYHWHSSGLSHAPSHADFAADSAAHVPHARVVPPLAPLSVARPGIPWEDTVIYEAHVKGLTCLHPDIPDAQRGRYLGVSHPLMIDYYQTLGITALQLLPVHFGIDELHLQQQGRSNYWGYNPLAWFAPTPRYAQEDPISEFRTMVEQLHAAGIEVLLDVVFNHSAEGDERGPTLSLRGLDNAVYYRRTGAAGFVFSNESGCGNALDTDQPAVLQLIMDCLRFWADDMGVDGFRFDLASALSRRNGQFDSGHALWSAILQDPVLRNLKLIAEPWDVGEDGYHLGQYPEGISEWNDRFRNDLRCFVRGDEGLLGNFAKRVAGSWDIFRRAGTGARASLNYITAHDGFTLRDLVSYQHKHNEANGEHNHDGSHENFSAGYGAEGETADASILPVRLRQQYNFIALLGWSQGVPMLLHGDESGRTQQGNNNAYCQDSMLAWCHWPALQPALTDFTRRVLQLRRQLGLGSLYSLRAPLWQQINQCFGFYRPDGQRMHDDDWMQSFARSLCVEMISADRRVLLLVNMHVEALRFVLPLPEAGRVWQLQLDTSRFTAQSTASPPATVTESCTLPETCYLLEGRSVALLADVPVLQALTDAVN